MKMRNLEIELFDNDEVALFQCQEGHSPSVVYIPICQLGPVIDELKRILEEGNVSKN